MTMKAIPKPENFDSLSKEQQDIYEWLSKVKFRKAHFGGLDEADVWSKLGELNALYEKLLIAERARYREYDDPAGIAAEESHE